MTTGPTISRLATLMGDPARANMLTALMDGRALTASELAHTAGIGLPTASSHLAKLTEGHLLSVENQGRHRYFRLTSPDVAHALETLMGLAEKSGHKPVRTGPRDPALRDARVCYDHLAGTRAVALYDRLVAQKYLELSSDGIALTAKGQAFVTTAGIGLDELTAHRRPLCRACLDWSSRRHHLAGSLGAAILDHALARRWARRDPGTRIITFTRSGEAYFNKLYGLG